MERETYLAHIITQTEYEAEYDKAAKKLLANRIVLARILKGCTPEFKDCDISDIAQKYIEREPEIGLTGVYMDDTNSVNKADTKVREMNSEDASQSEGTVYYDVRFNAIAPLTGKKEYIRLIINVEAQNRFKPQYALTKRAVYYCGRLISAQHGTVFTNSEYHKLRKVYSIWICVNPAKAFRNTITRYSLQPEPIVGNVVESRENYDLISIVMVCLGRTEEWGEPDLLKFLGILFKEELSADEKKDILEREFDIPMTETFESEVREMCNLSEGVLEKGIQRGIGQGIEQGIQRGKEQGRESALVELVNDGTITLEKAAEKAQMTVEEFKTVMQRVNSRENYRM